MKWFKNHKIISISLILICAYLIFGTIYSYDYDASQEQNSKGTVQEVKPVAVQGLYSEVQKQRQKYNLTALTHNPNLDTSAQAKCEDMSKNSYYDHINPTTGKKGNTYIFDIEKSAVYGGEILDQGTDKSYVYTSREFMNSWMTSPDHKTSILDPRYTDIGFAVCTESGKQTIVGHLAELKSTQ